MFKKRVQKSKPLELFKNEENHLTDDIIVNTTSGYSGNEQNESDDTHNHPNTKIKNSFSTKEKTEEVKNTVDSMMKNLAYESNYNLVIYLY